MEPVTTAAAISAGISALSGGAQAYATGKQNKKSRAFSREMYEKTKADNIKFWDMQNQYNSPEAQMQRLKSAGLNPNMVYDKGGAIQAAGNISSPDVQGGQFRTPDFGMIGGTISQYFDTRIKQAQYNNLEATNNEIQQRALLLNAQGLNEYSKIAGTRAASKLAELTLFPAAEAVSLQNLQTKANIQFTTDSNIRAQLMSGKSLQLIGQDILLRAQQVANTTQERANLKAAYNNLVKEGTLKNYEISLRRLGINPSDPSYVRMGVQGLQELMPHLPSSMSELLDGVKGAWDSTKKWFQK
jgi:hypothetical protein